MVRQIGSSNVADRATANAPLDHAVVIEHGHAVGGEPDVALQPGRTEFECQLEGLERVLRSMRAGASMSERDRRIEQGGETLLH